MHAILTKPPAMTAHRLLHASFALSLRCGLLLTTLAAVAQEAVVIAPAPAVSASASAATATATAIATATAATADKPTVWEGAIGLTASYRPEYSGAAHNAGRLGPGFFLRYGRVTITNASGFVTRRADDVVRGLGVDFVNHERLRLNLALRYDRGRSESSSSALSGLGNVKTTVRTRLNLGWRLDGRWRLGASWSVDALGRGGGYYGDLGVGWEQRLDSHLVLTGGVYLTLAGQRYMQSYYGVSDQQAVSSGYAPYQPKAGLRDVVGSLGFRTDLAPDWVLLGGASVSQLLGPAAASPLTAHRGGWGANLGLAWRF